MANRRFEMHQIRQVLVHMRSGQSDRDIARAGLMGGRGGTPLLFCVTLRLTFAVRRQAMTRVRGEEG